MRESSEDFGPFEYHTKNKITYEEVLQRTGQIHLKDTVAERRFRFAGHIIRLLQECPAHCAMDWTPERGGGQEKERKTKEDMADNIQKDLQLRGISWCEVEAAAAAERTRWRYLAAHCPAKDRRN